MNINNRLRELAKKQFNVDLDALPEREQRVVQHFGDRQHVSHDTNLEFEKKLTFGQRLADKVAMFGGSWTFIIIFAAILLTWCCLILSFSRGMVKHLMYIPIFY